MDWKTFIAQVIDSLAWPAALLFVVFLLREKLLELIPRLKRLKHKETEIEFTDKVQELIEERAAKDGADQRFLVSPEYEDKFNFLMRLADVSPRAAVLESFRVVESAAAKKAAALYPDHETQKIRGPLQLQKMLKTEVLDNRDFHQFDQLRKLRNEAAHAEEFDVRGLPVESYIDIALSLASRLESVND